MSKIIYRIRRRWAFMTTPASETQTWAEWSAEYDRRRRHVCRSWPA
jgi:hypothetical protein